MKGQLAFCLAVAASAFACRHGRDELSGPDAQRISALALAPDTVADDTVNANEGDATDWRYVDVETPGVLDLKLHWDNERASLSLGLFDPLGQPMATGVVSGPTGRKLTFEVPEKGRYYVRIAAEGDRDESPYSVTASVQRKLSASCHDCTVGQQTCIAKDAFAVCRQTKGGCNAWIEINSCGPDQTCRDGTCGTGCVDQCAPDERRCSAPDAAQICTRGPAGCMAWGAPVTCDEGQTCEKGRCRKSEKPNPKPPGGRPQPAASAETFVPGRIISMYMKEGRRTLHIEVGEGKGIQVGSSGVVLEGGTDNPVANGQFKVVRVTGAFVIAETTLEAIGNNRSVKIKVSP